MAGSRVSTGKVELGQGTTTSLAQLVAEELDVAFDAVDMVMADTDLFPWDRGTVGSLGISQFRPVLRAAVAEARAVLLQLAAERLGVPEKRLRVTTGTVYDSAAPENRVTYATIAGGDRIERHLAGTPPKPASVYRTVGQSPRRKDATAKVTGRAKYAADVRLPGHAVCPTGPATVSRRAAQKRRHQCGGQTPRSTGDPGRRSDRGYAALVHIEGSKVNVWASAQVPYRVKQEVAYGDVYGHHGGGERGAENQQGKSQAGGLRP